MEAYEDPNHVGNSSKFHTGKNCITPGCNNPAGTAWGKYWCMECNIKRIKTIDTSFNHMMKKFHEVENG